VGNVIKQQEFQNINMSIENKKKITKITIKKIMQDAEPIIRRDADTFYVKSSNPLKEPWFVFRDRHGNWYCDCPDFYYKLPGEGKKPTYHCKHINMAENYR